MKKEVDETRIELVRDHELAGVEGLQTQYRIPGGYWLPKSDDYIREPKEGIDVLTTIDMHLQDVATSSLRKQLLRTLCCLGSSCTYGSRKSLCKSYL